MTILNVTRVLARIHSSVPKQPCNQAFKEKITGASHLLEPREKNAGSHLIQVLPKTSQSCWCNLNRSTVANGSTEVLLMDLWNPIHRLGVIRGSSRSAGNLLNGWTDPRQLRESGLCSHNFCDPSGETSRKVSMTDELKTSANFDLVSRFQGTLCFRHENHQHRVQIPLNRRSTTRPFTFCGNSRRPHSSSRKGKPHHWWASSRNRSVKHKWCPRC